MESGKGDSMKDFEQILKLKFHRAIEKVLGDMAEDGAHWPDVYISSDAGHLASDAAANVILAVVVNQREAEAEGLIKSA